jgi:hypothetical protein
MVVAESAVLTRAGTRKMGEPGVLASGQGSSYSIEMFARRLGGQFGCNSISYYLFVLFCVILEYSRRQEIYPFAHSVIRRGAM